MGSTFDRFDMNRLVIFVVTLCYLLDNCGRIYGEAASLEGTSDDQELEKRSAPGGMWFGPRLGKRSRDYDYDSAQLQNMLLEAMMNNPNSVYGFNGSKRRLTPRLGRDSSEQDKIGSSKMVDFIPRLGRHADFIPRLGRELTPMMMKNLMFYKAIGEDRGPAMTDSKVPPFAPRLGRELYDFYDISPLLYKEDVERFTRSTESSNSAPKASAKGQTNKS